ncbi:MAG: hypothetical protein RIT45_923, partial [Pseudomonadota bacterium]
MASRHSFRMFAAVLLLTGVLAGCGDDDPVLAKTDVSGADTDAGGGLDADIIGGDTTVTATLSFQVDTKKGPALVDPTNAAIFDLSMDKYDTLADPGFQIDVVVTGKNVPNGTTIDVLVEGKSAGTGTMTDGAATIEKVTIPCASGNQLALAVNAQVSGQAVATTKSVLLNCGNACNAALVPVAECLNQDADTATDGFQAAFTVTTATTDCTHAYLKVTDTTGKISESEKVALSGGKATVIATLAPGASGLNGAQASVVAVVEDQAHTDRPSGQSAAQQVTITTDKPEITFLSPASGTVTLANDTDGNSENGIQFALVGTVTTLTASDVQAIQVFVDDVEKGKTQLNLNNSFEFDLSFEASKEYKIKVIATNSCGLVGEAETTFTAIASKASITITSPLGGATLLAKDDANKATDKIFETSIEVALQNAIDGTNISVFCRKNEVGAPYSTTAVGTATVSGGAGTLTIPVAIDTETFGSAVSCLARDDAGNPAESLPVNFVVAIPAPCMTIQLPTEGFVTAATSLSIGATATGLEGAIVEAKVTLNGGATFIDTPVSKVQNGSFTASVALQVGSPPIALPDGTYTVTLDATDSYGNKASDGNCSTLSRT